MFCHMYILGPSATLTAVAIPFPISNAFLHAPLTSKLLYHRLLQLVFVCLWSSDNWVLLRPVVTDGVAWSVGLSIDESVTVVSPTKIAEPAEMLLGLWTRMGPRNRIRWGAHWCYLANTTEPAVCGDDAALCHISLITCSWLLWVWLLVPTQLITWKDSSLCVDRHIKFSSLTL